MMHSVHFLTSVTINSRKGWIAPVESERPQDGVLVVPVSGAAAKLYSNYSLECSVYQGSGRYDRLHTTMDLQPNGSLKVLVHGHTVTFARRLIDGKPVTFDYIGHLTHADFKYPLCEIAPEEQGVLDELYNKQHVIVAGCEPESEYGGLSAFITSTRRQPMVTLRFKNEDVPDFDSLVKKPFDLKSPSRSTVPMLAYWSHPDARLAGYVRALGLAEPTNETLTFEYTVSPPRGKGKASHTDLMIVSNSLAVGTEAKYTEPKYDLVSKWLKKPPTANKKLVLEGWLGMINRATGANLTVAGVQGITYQLIHRTASVCSVQAEKRAVVYHCFDCTDAMRNSYEGHLRDLARLIAAPDILSLYLYCTALSKSNAYAEMLRKWRANEDRDFSCEVRKLLHERNVCTFGDPIVLKI